MRKIDEEFQEKLTKFDIETTKKTGDISFWSKLQLYSLVGFIGFFIFAIFSEYHLIYFLLGLIALIINIYSFGRRSKEAIKK